MSYSTTHVTFFLFSAPSLFQKFLLVTDYIQRIPASQRKKGSCCSLDKRTGVHSDPGRTHVRSCNCSAQNPATAPGSLAQSTVTPCSNPSHTGAHVYRACVRARARAHTHTHTHTHTYTRTYALSQWSGHRQATLPWPFVFVCPLRPENHFAGQTHGFLPDKQQVS